MRVEFAAKVKAEAFQRANGHCEKCTAKLYPGKYEYDHEIPCALGGDASVSNCVVKCKNCHRVKTRSDVAVIAKAKRRQRQFAGVRKPRTITRWRNMRGEIVEAPRER